MSCVFSVPFGDAVTKHHMVLRSGMLTWVGRNSVRGRSASIQG